MSINFDASNSQFDVLRGKNFNNSDLSKYYTICFPHQQDGNNGLVQQPQRVNSKTIAELMKDLASRSSTQPTTSTQPYAEPDITEEEFQEIIEIVREMLGLDNETSATTTTTPSGTSTGATTSADEASTTDPAKVRAAVSRIIGKTATPEDVALVERAKQEKIQQQQQQMATEKASNGLTYNQAKAILMDILDKNKGNLMGDCSSGPLLVKRNGFTTKNLSVYDKQRLQVANAAMNELEQKFGFKNGTISLNGQKELSDTSRLASFQFSKEYAKRDGSYGLNVSLLTLATDGIPKNYLA